MGYRSRVYKRTKLGNGKVMVESVDSGTYGIWLICKILFWYPIKYTFLLMYWMFALPIKGIIALVNKAKENKE